MDVKKEKANVNSLSIVLWYADNKIWTRELTLVLTGRDWFEFEKQSFYPELIQFLHNLGIQGNIEKQKAG
ncbi:hypothetical protein [Eubacterium callanderi]|uniref:hypothetical protein n=1 Tax=Eubacterium callanderi TaxID=53442 RepID=UPI0026738D3C|nr:hypothetical protein [Eubacterium callanderi]